MKYSAALPMFLGEGAKTYFRLLSMLSHDNLRSFFFRTLRRSKDVIFREENIHKILLDLFRK